MTQIKQRLYLCESIWGNTIASWNLSENDETVKIGELSVSGGSISAMRIGDEVIVDRPGFAEESITIPANVMIQGFHGYDGKILRDIMKEGEVYDAFLTPRWV